MTFLKTNLEKCHLLVPSNECEHMWSKIGDDTVLESRTVMLLSITIDNELKLEEHIYNVCMTA